MIRRSTLIIVVIFAALVVVAVFWQRSQDEKEASATPTETTQYLFQFDSKIDRLRLERSAGGLVELGRDEQGIWTLLYPAGQETDIGAAESAVTQLLALPVVSTLPEGPSLQDAGLSSPTYRLVIDLDDGSQVVMNVGKATPTGTGYYVLVSGQGLAIVSKYSLDPFLNLVESPPIKPTPTPGVEYPLPETGTQPYPVLEVTSAP